MESNLTLYRIFNSVAATGNISRSSKELFISQPAVSKAVQTLEDNLKMTLFIRSSRGVRLTEEGALLYEYTKSAFDTLSEGESTLLRMKELGIGHLRIGVSNTLCKYILLPYLKDFIKKYPHIKITIECQSTYKTLELLGQNKIDIGLIGRPANLKGMDFYEIQKIEDIFVSTQAYLDNLNQQLSKTFRRKPTISPEDTLDILSNSNVLLLDEKNITRLYVEDYFTRNNIKTNQLLEVSSMDLLIEFAKIGLGISCVIKEFVQDELTSKELIELPLNPPLEKRAVGFSYCKDAFLSQAVKHFIDFYKERSLR